MAHSVNSAVNSSATNSPSLPWEHLNQQYLLAAIAQVTWQVAQQLPNFGLNQPFEPVRQNDQPDPLPAIAPMAAIEQLCRVFALSDFERAIVLLGMGMELNGSLPNLLSRFREPNRHPELPDNASTDISSSLTFSFALSHMPGAHWNAITPESPLRRWQLLEMGTATTLIHSPLRLNERIIHFLLGDEQLDPQLVGVVTVLDTTHLVPLPPSQQQIVNEVNGLLRSPTTSSGLQPVIQLCGYDSATKRTIASTACAELGLSLVNLAADSLPSDFTQLKSLQTLWEREAMLRGGVLLLDCDGLPDVTENAAPSPVLGAIARLMESCQPPLIVLSRDRRPIRQRPIFNFDIIQPTATEQRHLWTHSLELAHRNGSAHQPLALHTHEIDKLVSHFSLSPLTIQTICTQSLHGKSHPASPAETTVNPLPQRLWTACLSHARPRLEELAQPIRTQVDWQDLILPEKEKQTLRTIAAQVKQRVKVYEQWGFGLRSDRGLGISALFAGASGTGKTLAAEVLANELHLDLYRIDLSSVVSKYIGETEKNLRRIFDAAEQGGSILLFDEADALFGKRSEVKDSHDRYANMEVAYLLQRMEAYRGLAILTTNLKNSLDQAFLRRLRFVVQFPFPDASQRAEIWQRVFPSQTPIANLSYTKLARLNVAGGNIRNIALNAAFLAAEEDGAIEMAHILQAAQSEYIKLERPLTETEIKGWV